MQLNAVHVVLRQQRVKIAHGMQISTKRCVCLLCLRARVCVCVRACPFRSSQSPYRYSDNPYQYSESPYRYSVWPYRYSVWPCRYSISIIDYGACGAVEVVYGQAQQQASCYRISQLRFTHQEMSEKVLLNIKQQQQTIPSIIKLKTQQSNKILDDTINSCKNQLTRFLRKTLKMAINN